MKFVNPGLQHVRVSLLSGHIADFPPGEVVEVPDLMKADCLAKNLTPVEDDEVEVAPTNKKPAKGGKKAAKPADAPGVDEAASDDDESVVNVADAQ